MREICWENVGKDGGRDGGKDGGTCWNSEWKVNGLCLRDSPTAEEWNRLFSTAHCKSGKAIYNLDHNRCII